MSIFDQPTKWGSGCAGRHIVNFDLLASFSVVGMAVVMAEKYGVWGPIRRRCRFPRSPFDSPMPIGRPTTDGKRLTEMSIRITIMH